MKMQNLLATSVFALSLVAAPAFAAEPMKKMEMKSMMESCDMDHDGMMSKAEMVKHMEAMFDKMDTKKTGKLDKKQTDAFMKELTKLSGG